MVEVWKEATNHAPELLHELLSCPKAAIRVKAVLNDIAQARLRQLAEDAAASRQASGSLLAPGA